MSQPTDAFLVVNGWTIFAHPLFRDQIEVLLKQIEAFRQKDPSGYVRKNASKCLAAITQLAFEIIPQDQCWVEYRQGNAFGEEHKHWFRAKFFQPKNRSCNVRKPFVPSLSKHERLSHVYPFGEHSKTPLTLRQAQGERDFGMLNCGF